jgi:hypothetical protein
MEFLQTRFRKSYLCAINILFLDEQNSPITLIQNIESLYPYVPPFLK